MKITYECMVCGGLVSTDPAYNWTCICAAGPTAPPFQSAKELSGNGAGLDAPSPVKLEDEE